MNTKNWVGNKNSIFKTLGATNHTKEDREINDFYATEPKATELLLDLEVFNDNIWECACGNGDIAKILMQHNKKVLCSDIIQRDYKLHATIDFLKNTKRFNGDIITNPPYKFAEQFVRKSLDAISSGSKVAMFLKTLFMESKGRKKLFIEYPPKTIWVSASRLLCAKNGNFKKHNSAAVSYSWFIWVKGYTGETTIKWFN